MQEMNKVINTRPMLFKNKHRQIDPPTLSGPLLTFSPSKTDITMNIIGLLSHRRWSNGILYSLVEFLLSPVGELISVWIHSLFHYSDLSQ